MSYKVVIPTAGLGTRLGKITKYINKSLVSVAHKPIISWQFEKFPNDSEFIIPIGYKGELVRDYLNLVYPNKKITFVEIENFQGKNSGLGHTLLKCEDHLQHKFLFIACDSLIMEDLPNNDNNWIGYSSMKTQDSAYRVVEIEQNKLNKIHEKGYIQKNNLYPYIGLCQINDFETFWDKMRKNQDKSILEGESYGINSMLIDDIEFSAYAFNWSDTGNLECLEKIRQKYKDETDYNILEKENEHIWFVDEKVIKFSAEKEFIKNRVKRVNFLKGYVPEIIGSSSNLYLYKLFKGKVFSKIRDSNKFIDLLAHSKGFWKIHNLDDDKKKIFKSACKKFYRDKSISRIKKFFVLFNKKDNLDFINGKKVKNLEILLEKINWDFISDGLPVRFHGDFHFENILFKENQFMFVDWRQEFGGNLEYGDLYYDLAKLLHGLIVNHGIINNEEYTVDWQDNKLSYSIKRIKFLEDCENLFFEWLDSEKYDSKKVNIITALIFLNIAALHHYPYCLLLYGLGIEKLNDNI